jgi:hypothetical protein
VSTPDQNAPTARPFDVGVALVPLQEIVPAQRDETQRASDSGIPGYDEVIGRGRPHPADRAPFLVQRGEAAVRAATEAIAAQIGLAADQIATAIGARLESSAPAGPFGVESVSISFGVTLAAGVQAMFTAQAESSVQVTISLSPRRVAAG